MRIAIDASGAAKAARTGVARYVSSLVEALLRAGPEHEIVLATRLSRWRRRAHRLRPAAPNVRLRWLQEPFAGWIRREADVFHGPDLRIPAIRGVPLVATVHDAFSLTSDAFGDERFRRRRGARYREVVERAAAILTVSRASRDRLAELLGAPAERFRVVPLGVDARFRPLEPQAVAAVLRRHRLPARYLLTVGQLSRRKNLPRLVEAFGRLAPDRVDLHLVLAGGASFGAEEVFAAIEASPFRERIRPTGHFPDEDLPALYAGAAALAFPSLDEGFGLPAIEAMACGTPVVASASGALPEVTAGAAILAGAEDVDALAGSLAEVLEGGSRREELVARGLRRAAELTWDRCAELTLAAYRDVVGP